MPRTRSGNAGKRQAPPGKARGRSAQVKADNETKAKNAKAKEQEKTKDQQMAVVLMEQEQASVDEEVCITRVTRRTTRGAALLAQRREVEPAPAPVQAPKKRTRSEQKAEEAEEKRRLAREEMMEVHVDSDEDARFQADESSLSELSAEEDEDPTPTPGGDVEEETETETEPEEEDAPKPQKKKRKVAESTTDVDIPEEQPTAQIRKRQANSEQSTGDVSRQPRPDPKPLKRPPRHEVTHDDSSMQDQEPIRAKPSKVKGRKKRDDPDFFEDYNVTEYVVVDGDNEYTESGSDDEEVLATQASLSRKGVQVSSASLVKVHTGLIVKKKAAPKSDMINTEDADVAPKKAISTSSSRTQHEDAEAAPPLIVRKYVEATPKKKRVAPTLSESSTPVEVEGPQLAIDVDDAQEKSKQKRWTNADLPAGAHQNNRWKNTVLPTLVWYFGIQKYPWQIKDDEFCRVLQRIWNAVYGKRLPYTVKTGESVHGLAMVRVREWRGSFGSNALRALKHFFEEDPEFKTDADRALFCDAQLRKGQILFQATDKRQGLYRSKHVLRTLAPHLDSIKNAVEVPGLLPDPDDDYPYGALGLAAAAVIRAALLYKAQKVVIDGRKISISKNVNHLTGKETRSKETDFSEANFGERTRSCVQAAIKLGLDKLDEIYALAEKAWATSDEDEADEVDDDRLSASMLVEEESEEEEEDSEDE